MLITNEQLRQSVIDYVMNAPNGKTIRSMELVLWAFGQAQKRVKPEDRQEPTLPEKLAAKAVVIRQLKTLKEDGYVRALPSSHFMVAKEPVPEAMRIVVDLRKQLETHVAIQLAVEVEQYKKGTTRLKTRSKGSPDDPLKPLDDCMAALEAFGEELRRAAVGERKNAARAFHAADMAMHVKVPELLGPDYSWAVQILQTLFHSMGPLHMGEVVHMAKSDIVIAEHAAWHRAIRDGDVDKIAQAIAGHLEGTVQRNLEYRRFVEEEEGRVKKP